MTLTFYSNVVSSPCRAVWLTLKTLGVDFVLKEIDFGGNEHKSDEFLAVNPRGKVPAIKDGELCLGERCVEKLQYTHLLVLIVHSSSQSTVTYTLVALCMECK